MTDTKILQFDTDVRASLLRGVETLALAVQATLGPSGRNVILQKKHNALPTSTKDGVSVAKEIKLKDPFENQGAQILKEASLKTATHAGDGTTTSTVIAYNLFKAACESLANNPTINAILLKREIDNLCQEAVEKIREVSVPVTTSEDIFSVATVSANNDSQIGQLIASAIEKVGRDGIIYVEEGNTAETQLELVEGLQFKRGYASPYFVTNQHKFTTELEDAIIVVTDVAVTSFSQIEAPANVAMKNGKPLVIIAEKIGDEALATLVVNKMRGTLKACAVQAPEFGEKRRQILEDIAMATGATFLSAQRGTPYPTDVNDWTDAMFGSAKKVIVTKTDTTIVEGNCDKDAIQKRVNELKEQLESTSLAPVDKEKIQERLARLIGGVAIIRVGANTEVEMKEKRDRIDDAVQATKAALEEGIVPGGGKMLLMTRVDPLSRYTPVKLLAVLLFNQAVAAPLRTICDNAGISKDEIDNIIKTITKSGKDTWDGYNLLEDKYCNLREKGIVDPAKVTRVALENAISVAGTLMTTAAAVVIDPEESKPQQEIDPAMFMQ